jgi:hypothetical protein
LPLFSLGLRRLCGEAKRPTRPYARLDGLECALLGLWLGELLVLSSSAFGMRTPRWLFRLPVYCVPLLLPDIEALEDPLVLAARH